MSYVSDQYAGMASDILQIQRDREQHKLNRRNDSDFNRLNGYFLKVVDDKAHILAQRAALSNYIRALFNDKDVFIPAMDNPSVWDSIGKAGIAAYGQTEDWEAVKEAGRTFPLPAGPDIFKNHVPCDKFLAQNDALIEASVNLKNDAVIIAELSAKISNYENIIEKLKRENIALMRNSMRDKTNINNLIQQISGLNEILLITSNLIQK